MLPNRLPIPFRPQRSFSRISLFVGLMLSIASPASHAHTSDSKEGGEGANSVYQTWGYQPWWMQANWPRLDLGQWQRVILFELPIEAEGRIGGRDKLRMGWEDMAHQAARCGTAFDLAFTLFEEQKFEQLFSSATRRSALLHEMLALHGQVGAKGIHLDVEIYQRVSPQAITGYRDFVRKLGMQLRKRGGAQVLSVFGVIGAAQELLDASTIASLDYVVVQGYDAHWRGSPTAGSIAPLKGSHQLTWEKSLQYYLNIGVPRSRLLFSVPYFGYEWPVVSDQPGSASTGKAREMTYAPLPAQWVPDIRLSALEQIRQHQFSRDPETGSPYYVYQDAHGRWWQGWYEDEASLARKLAFVEKEKLAGIAAFPLGYDAGKFDALLASSWGKRAQCRAVPNSAVP